MISPTDCSSQIYAFVWSLTSGLTSLSVDPCALSSKTTANSSSRTGDFSFGAIAWITFKTLKIKKIEHLFPNSLPLNLSDHDMGDFSLSAFGAPILRLPQMCSAAFLQLISYRTSRGVIPVCAFSFNSGILLGTGSPNSCASFTPKTLLQMLRQPLFSTPGQSLFSVGLFWSSLLLRSLQTW